MTQRHKHADAIIAWANGAQIEGQAEWEKDVWRLLTNPQFVDNWRYRVKPVPKPDVVRYRGIPYVDTTGSHGVWAEKKQVDSKAIAIEKITYDGETGKIKSIELVEKE